MMSRRKVIAAATTAVAALVPFASACSGENSTYAADTIEKTTPPQISARDYDRNNFSSPTTVDNAWFPLRPGIQLVFRGLTVDAEERVPHLVIFTVTDLVKEIDGVRSVVLWDRDYSAGELVESEIAFFAQDDDGNVWQTGEYPQEYDNGNIVASPIWIHGQKGAKAGLTMRVDPRLGTTDYALGWGPAVGFNDRARVLRMGETNCVPLGCYRNVLVIDEFNPDEPGKHQLKFHARGIGNIRVGWSGKNEDTKETLVLVGINALDAKGMAEARAEAIKLEESAYKRRAAVYGNTPPLARG
jgi:hypothetical protein